ncbi:MAG TPA: ATP-binding protein [Bryobacteraceae bacterium]|nr:ATP-binding protein [Bryobacteraceae bacterium]
MKRDRFHLSHERRLELLALAAGLPAIVALAVILGVGDYSSKLRWTLAVLVGGAWLGFAAAVRDRAASPLRTLANLLEAMREGDYSIRARGARGDDALGEVMQQVNAMGATLRAQRLGALEATALLRTVMEEINVGVFAFDAGRVLRLVNRAGEKILAQPQERLLNRSAEELGLAEYLEGEPTRTQARTFPGGSGRWGISRSAFREGGLPHQLLVVTDLTQPLRAEELQAWQRLVRVLGHELNNSLAPIKSIAGSLASLLMRAQRAPDWEDDMRSGLEVIAARSEALSRFLSAYARLAKLPPPTFRTVQLDEWVPRVAAMEIRVKPLIRAGPPVAVEADPDQLEQVMINLIRNAADASLDTGGGVEVGWARNGSAVELFVRDEGPGLANTSNLFVPFFTTKPGGSGIGLVLSRQIAEAHGGTLALRNRTPGPGCEAVLTLPL